MRPASSPTAENGHTRNAAGPLPPRELLRRRRLFHCDLKLR